MVGPGGRISDWAASHAVYDIMSSVISLRDRLNQMVEMRRAEGLSQADLAARMSTSQAAVARIESTDSDPRLSTLERYAKALNDALREKGVAVPETYSLDLIERFSAAVFANASSLYEDAQLLLAAGHRPRAYALAELAAEELGKCLILIRVGTDVALGNKVDWKDTTRRLGEHGSKLRVLLLFDWAITDQAAAYAAHDVEALVGDGAGRRRAASEANEALLLRERALYVEVGPAGLTTPDASIAPADAEMMVNAVHSTIGKMKALGLPPVPGEYKRRARSVDFRKTATGLRRTLNRLPGIVPYE